MKQKVLNLDNKVVKEIEISDLILNTKVYPDIIHEYIRYQMAKSRQGSHKTKTRSEVRGKSKKPFSQKGTGNARQGSSKAPHFRGGAVSMGPQNRDHSFNLNKKEKKLALKCTLSDKMKKNEIILVDSLEIKSHRTKDLSKSLRNFSFNREYPARTNQSAQPARLWLPAPFHKPNHQRKRTAAPDYPCCDKK